jgi:hypothetical protein
MEQKDYREHLVPELGSVHLKHELSDVGLMKKLDAVAVHRMLKEPRIQSVCFQRTDAIAYGGSVLHAALSVLGDAILLVATT